MREVIDGLFVGGKDSPELMEESDELAVVHVCDDRLFLELLRSEGYPDENASFVKAPSKLLLKLTNADSPDAFDAKLFKEAINFINLKLATEHNVLLYGDGGKSRAPSIALLYLATKGKVPKDSFEKAETAFRKKYYAAYEPSKGIAEFLKTNWTKLVG